MSETRTTCRENERWSQAWVAVICVGIVTSAAERFCLRADEQPAALAPGGTILFSSLAPRGWDVYVANGHTPRTRRLTDDPNLDYNAAFSPDGQRTAFVSERDGNLELYAINRDGTDLKRLTNDFALDDHPAWSPDGKRIAFSSTRQPATTPGRAWNAIYVMQVDGGTVERVSPEDSTDYSPAWSPQGDLIACASGSGVPGGTDLYVMQPDGGARRLVVKNGGWPAFAADGESLFFHRKTGDNWGIWRVMLDGSGPQRVTPADVEAFTPRTSPDGQWLVAAVQRGRHRQIERFELATKHFTPVTTGTRRSLEPVDLGRWPGPLSSRSSRVPRA